MDDLTRTTITSMEAAEWCGKKHTDLLRDIRRYTCLLYTSGRALEPYPVRWCISGAGWQPVGQYRWTVIYLGGGIQFWADAGSERDTDGAPASKHIGMTCDATQLK